MDKGLKYIAENLEEWPDHSVDTVFVSAHGEICFTSVEHDINDLSLFDFYPEGVKRICGEAEEGFTREQWEQARKELGLDKEWKGIEDGLPPIGTVLENWAGQKRTVIAHDQGSVVCELGDKRGHT